MTDKERAIVQAYNDWYPKIIKAVQKKYEAGGYADDEHSKKFLDVEANRLASKANIDPGAVEHATVTPENIKSIFNSEQIDHDIYDMLYDIAIEEGYLEEPDDNEDENYDPADAIKRILANAEREKWDTGMPAKVYRGQYPSSFRDWDPEVEGFKGALEEIDLDAVGGEYTPLAEAIRNTFVTTEPSAAATYGLRRHFDNREPMSDKAINFADYIYEILTEGLDPALFEKDDSGSSGEDLFAPQYKYRGPIRQEMVKIKDIAGNDREVPRIRKIHYPSDGNLKTVIWPKHLIDASRTRF